MHKHDSAGSVMYVEHGVHVHLVISLPLHGSSAGVSVIHLSSSVFIHTRDDDLTSHPLTSVRAIHSLSVSPQLSDVIIEITDNDIGADGARYIADAIKTCTSLTTLNLQGI